MPYPKWGPIRSWAALCGLILLPLNLLSHPDHGQLGAPLSTQSAFQHAQNGFFSTSTTTNKAPQSDDQSQQTWNANSLAITDPHVQFTSYLDHDRATRTLSSTWFPLWSDRLDPFERTVRGRGTTRGSTVSRSRVSPVQEQWGCRRDMVTIYQVFQLYYLLMKFTGIGVAFSALEKLHLVTTFIFGGRGLLNLSESRSEVLYIIPYSFHRHFDNKRQHHAKSQTTTMHNNNTTVPVLVLLVVSLTAIANTGFWGSEVLRKLRRQSAQHPQRQRNQRQHQRHLPSFLMQLTALPFRFGLHPQYPHSTTLPYPRSLYLTTNISLLCLH